ncbi:hypothetical protein CDD80_3176 [Ophiocordyceps camponoti-rufipedis]|uniref:LNS2/PITP domain-containing protein n=1 Tax=Ophiocordyceps camponoti-rufipedis TaxID=2004952 RepID=A0A2C5Z2T2_9HYPO|nr:hypothetical protein CDD80_3176 [Ophiocordyceps camponoti-rufipedis]
MQYVRNFSDSVSTAWNSINPATLSGAIDVIVVEHEDGSLSCSPFHVRFGKFSLLRPYEKKVEFRVNGVKQEYSMKLGEGGEAFFVFETTDTIPESLRTSPLVSPANSPHLQSATALQDPDPLELNDDSSAAHRPSATALQTQSGDDGILTPASTPPCLSSSQPTAAADWGSTMIRNHTDEILRPSARARQRGAGPASGLTAAAEDGSERSTSPPPLAPREALQRARVLSKELSAANIPTHVTEAGDLMLDMAGFRSSEQDVLRAEVLARQILAEELDGNYDIGALFGFDELGNLWIYSSEEAKQAAMSKTIESSLQAHHEADAVSDPGYHSDGSDVTGSNHHHASHRRSGSDAGPSGLQTPPRTPPDTAHAGDPTRNYAKTLRLTSDQLKDLDLKPGENLMSFTVNRATCSANMYLWKEETPVVISDIDGTITKSDALGHVLNMIGRDWTHSGVAKLYSDIALNGYNIMYLTSRSVGQADTTRAYVNGIVQGGYRMPHGPTILSPDRTMAALRREIYLRKPHIFKMATLRDIRNLYGSDRTPFYAGFGNRLTDQISYRTVDVPRNRIFTINSNSEVSLDLLSLNKLKMSYVNINEVVDHYFPPVGTLVTGGGEDYTDFKYWRDDPLALDEFSASDSDDVDVPADAYSENYVDEEEDDDDEDDEDDEDDAGLGDSYLSRDEGQAMADSLASIIEDAAYEEDDEASYEDDDDGNDSASDDDDNDNDPTIRKPMEPHFVAEDVAAEVITGVGHLSLSR